MKYLENIAAIFKKMPEVLSLLYIMVNSKLRSRYFESIVQEKENEAQKLKAETYKLRAEGNKANMEALNILKDISNNTNLDEETLAERIVNYAERKFKTVVETIQISPPCLKWVKMKSKDSDVLKWIQVRVPAQNRIITKRVYA